MKVLTINARTAMILTLVIIALITVGIVLIFGNADSATEKTPEIEIVLP